MAKRAVDRNGLVIQDGDRVRVQTAQDGPVSDAVIERHHPDRTGPLAGLVLCRFDNGTGQYMAGRELEVVLCTS